MDDGDHEPRGGGDGTPNDRDPNDRDPDDVTPDIGGDADAPSDADKADAPSDETEASPDIGGRTDGGGDASRGDGARENVVRDNRAVAHDEATDDREAKGGDAEPEAAPDIGEAEASPDVGAERGASSDADEEREASPDIGGTPEPASPGPGGATAPSAVEGAVAEDPTPSAATEGAATTQEFYTRWAGLYDALATHSPGIGSLRERAIVRLGLNPGDVVVEMGCGTGANFPHLRERVGPSGAVVGVDYSPGVLGRARVRIDEEGWENVHVVRGDATDAPAGNIHEVTERHARRPDAVFASFLSGMLPAPRAAVREWADVVGPGGRLGLLDLARSTRPAGRVLNGAFAGLVFASSPTKEIDLEEAAQSVDHRVVEAHRELREICTDRHYSTHALGFARLSAGTVR